MRLHEALETAGCKCTETLTHVSGVWRRAIRHLRAQVPRPSHDFSHNGVLFKHVSFDGTVDEMGGGWGALLQGWSGGHRAWDNALCLGRGSKVRACEPSP